MHLQRQFLRVALTGVFGLAATHQAAAQAGKNGALTVNTTNVVVNAYTALTADAAAGATSLSVSSTSGLSNGDLVMIIQMQGATINTTNTSSYGTITAYNNAGNYELAVVQGLTATSLGLSKALSRSYTAAGKVQVVRVPRYTTVTINSGGSITGTAWDGTTGGVVALEANGTTTINGSIVASGLGFRGGATANNGTSNNANYVGTGNTGGEKGESIAGYGASYAGGSRGRGAPANGGGGGNSVNAGGGGGANGGAVASWTGTGRPSTSTAAWNSAWALETPSLAGTSSTGGGRGGYGVSDDNLDALTVGPDQPSWGQYGRPNTGGFGGRPLNYSTDRLYLGGGGGTGDGNTSVAGLGGRGGGLIYLSGPSFAGTGSVVSNGTAGGTSQANNPFADGAGGGGGGGTIIVNASVSVGAITLTADGGAGGNTENTVDKGYGPGGGGGAGYVGLASSSFNGTAIGLRGGANGVSTSPGLTEFPPNGATFGGNNSLVFRSFSASPLPVTWKSFTASPEGNRVRLAWATATELRTAYFSPERSTDGRTFSSFGQPIPAAGSSQTERRYTSYDEAPATQPVYYRIRQVDTDGATSYTPVVVVQAQSGAVAPAYPNPVRRGQRLHTAYSAGTTLLLHDLLGRQLPLITAPAANGTLDVDTRRLAAGLYLLSVPGGAAQRLEVQE
ncbi:T9SS type A sorting domain-containing protein [Hymenobacter aquaticus]|uniref:T9SS type A sorting domain-containing protein n=1 Tax=Hymenobacter aquaticus TaxID=1867101 RepID=A0A4Z0Q8K2_9BACT|nr:T9SS type A sorting domain-containing protein [Hymenobacter aquaticus]TGE25729.1 T9SS type A sorting domain-containing protein [Hymenobacter aquaticus]